MIIDLHNHTCNSYDGFTTPLELLNSCIQRGIGAIAVTEHDIPCTIDPGPFSERGIELIPGCEYTTESGAHVIGLFVKTGLPSGTKRSDIFAHILFEGGIAVMPHPWKLGSGYMAIHGEDDYLSNFSFIELINGGWKSGNFALSIREIANQYGIRMIATSDSHRGCQVSLCASRFLNKSSDREGVRTKLETAAQSDIELLIDRPILTKHGRRTKWFQRSSIYQDLLPIIPTQLRKSIKAAQYRLSKDRFARTPNFESVELENTTW